MLDASLCACQSDGVICKTKSVCPFCSTVIIVNILEVEANEVQSEENIVYRTVSYAMSESL